MSRVARNLILIGDQLQLSQPIKGRHTDHGGVTALDFRLGGLPTEPPDQGIFLHTTHPLHPNICKFISDHVYVNLIAILCLD